MKFYIYNKSLKKYKILTAVLIEFKLRIEERHIIIILNTILKNVVMILDRKNLKLK